MQVDDSMRAKYFFAFVVAVYFVAMLAPTSHAQLRIVTYNTNTFGTEEGFSRIRNARPEVDTVLQAIGEESVNGIARPADIILLQEQQRPSTTTRNLVDRLNAIYADQGITYSRGVQVGDTTSGNGSGALDDREIRQSVIFRTDSVQLISEDSFGDLSGGTISQPRETLLHQFRPVGYGADADLYIFNSHFEAGRASEDLAGRETEANQIRQYIDNNNLGDRNVIVAGDLNVGSNFETSGVSDFGGLSSMQLLSAPGSGRVLDPLFPGGEDVDFRIYNSGVPNTQFGVDLAPFLTQSPTGQGGDLTGGGIDDRFDFILQSDELLDGEGVASIGDSLRAFGNNGSTPNTTINNGNTISINGLTSFSTDEVLDALEAASDHLPVVTDFQVPAVLSVSVVDFVPETVQLGEVVQLEVNIFNSADVLLSLGADELDFQLSTLGNLFGAAMGTDEALGGVFSTLVTLDTSELGMRGGVVAVTSNSPGVANGQVFLPVSFNVVAVPEPGTLALLSVVGIGWFVRRRRDLRAY